LFWINPDPNCAHPPPSPLPPLLPSQITEAATGSGPIDAVYEAIAKCTRQAVILVDFRLESAGSSKTLGAVTVRLEQVSVCLEQVVAEVAV
jgi:hypothetical protein